jgi:hypothetical protein
MNPFAPPRAWPAFTAGCALLLAACAAPVRDARGLEIARGNPVAPRPPVTFQADLSVQPHAPGSLPFSARLYGETGGAVGGEHGADPGPDTAASYRYRLDAFGFPSAVVASWLWSGGRWTLVRHDRREVLSGEGFALGTEDSPIRIPDVRVVLGVLAGESLPGYPGLDEPRVDENGTVRWRYGNETWEAKVDRNTGLCREARSASLALRYARHHVRDGIVIPDMIEVLSGEGDTVLSLEVRDWTAAPAWKKNPFDLVVPASYERK